MISEIDQGLHAPTKIPKKIEMVKEESAPPPSVGVAGMSGMSGGAAGGVFGGMPGGMGTAPAPKVSAAPPPKPAGPIHISGGVIAGTILERTQPVYPPIARAAHVSGAVVLHAIIDKNGNIKDLKALSGPEMLKSSAIDAVQHWRYKPYLLNNEPTEVDTTITVNFNFGG